MLWKKIDNTAKAKLNIYNSIIRSKLVYGLETAGLTIGQNKKIDAFQQRGIRQILKIEPTFVDTNMCSAKQTP
eukprot:12328589-Karenia_brevis.AAC.1